jgi:putative tryptophan/tyrosine transport system substrate-binding protein
MRRREFITMLGSAAIWPRAARSQQPDRLRRIGVLIGFAESDPAVQSWLAAFRGALAKLGWREGNNLRIELRWAGYDLDRMKTFAKELVDLRPDAILSVTSPVTDALLRTTQTIPIVIATVADPISSGFVTNLGRPGGNVTGFALYEPGMGGKWVELLKQIAPGVTNGEYRQYVSRWSVLAIERVRADGAGSSVQLRA